MKIAAAALLSLASITGCDKNPYGLIDSRGSPPFISAALVQPDSIAASQSGSTVSVLLSASVSDPDGVQDVRQVTYQVYLPAGGDVTASGTVPRSISDSGTVSFLGTVSLNLANPPTGVYPIIVAATDQSGFQSNTVRLSLIVAGPDAAPFLGTPAFRYATDGSDTVRFTVRIPATDPDGIRDIDRVIIRLLNTNDSTAQLLYDDGLALHADALGGDGVYSGIFFRVPLTSPGDVVLAFQARDRQGQVSPVVLRRVLDHPPHILTIDVPTVIQRPASGSLPIAFHVSVADSDGLADIDSVFFRNFTSTTPSNFIMFDDGDQATHGDAVAADGTYSLIVQISSTNSTGPKEFHFYAVDKSGARDEQIRTITIQ